jgi:hypothetical protein
MILGLNFYVLALLLNDEISRSIEERIKFYFLSIFHMHDRFFPRFSEIKKS